MMISLLSLSFFLSTVFSSLHSHDCRFLSPPLSLSHPLSGSVSMKPRRRGSLSVSSTSATVTYTFRNDNSTPIPIKSPDRPSTPITVHFRDDHRPSTAAAAAARIQAAYRSYVVRRLVKKIAAVKSEVDRMERVIQRQETVDALRSSEREKVKMNEQLMRLLLELDSVPGFDPAVRELRRSVSRRIVALQEVVDGICGSGGFRMDAWDWDDVIGEMEERVCRERGGEELERFCALHLGFRCLQRFFREP